MTTLSLPIFRTHQGAHTGQGLAKIFKHIERTKHFVHLLDVSDYADRDVWQICDINEELRLYDELNKEFEWYTPIATRPQVVVFNKMTRPNRKRWSAGKRSFIKTESDVLKFPRPRDTT